MGRTSIEWCDHSINPIRARYASTDGDGHYCEKVSPGCTHCYSSRMQPRFGMPVFETQRRVNVEPYLHEPALRQVLGRKTPTRYFWCDMSDLFGAWVPDDWIDQCFAVMAFTPQHTHLVLTKRAERMRDYVTAAHRGVANVLRERFSVGGIRPQTAAWDNDDEFTMWPLPNVWLGVSAENQHFADERIPLLLQTPAAVRFISAEPLLGPVNLTEFIDRCSYYCDHGEMWPEGHRPARGLDWVIVGGESGSGARPFDLAWARSIVQQCKAAGVACFVKQLGGRPHTGITEMPDGARVENSLFLQHTKGGDPAEWPIDLRVREYPTGHAP